MGIRFSCPNGHKLNVKAALAGKRAICPNCGAKLVVPLPDELSGGTLPGGPPAEMKEPQAGVSAEASPQAEAPSVMIPIVESSADNTVKATRKQDVVIPGKPAAALQAPSPGGLSSASAFILQRRKQRQKQIKLAIVLFATAVVLAIVLVWVLTRSRGQDRIAGITEFQSGGYRMSGDV